MHGGVTPHSTWHFFKTNEDHAGSGTIYESCGDTEKFLRIDNDDGWANKKSLATTIVENVVKDDAMIKVGELQMLGGSAIAFSPLGLPPSVKVVIDTNASMDGTGPR